MDWVNLLLGALFLIFGIILGMIQIKDLMSNKPFRSGIAALLGGSLISIIGGIILIVQSI